ncbi:MAG: gliding motility-associated C-terminal domain-containing protein [Flavobacteriales bacterium]|nr:gliding motility-associated C-terminal domain-containing protein [Flavobacteriales bacterium]
MTKNICLLLCFLTISLLGNSQEVHHDHSLPHSFIENKGQWDEDVLFKTQFLGGNLWIEQGKMMFHLQDFSRLQAYHANPKDGEDVSTFPQTVLHLNFLGSNKVTSIQKEHETDVYYNYFLGNDESKWTSDVRGYGEATLEDFYNGIDLKLIEQEQELKYEFHVAAGADPSVIRLDYAGQNKIVINDKGDLVISTSLGDVIEKKPYAYQILNGKIVDVACSFRLNKSVVEFELGDYSPYAPLIIDPVLVFATYCGSVTDNFGMTATYGYDGTAYSGGVIYGNAYPTPDPLAYNTTSNFTVPNVGPITSDAFITKYSADGTTMIWTTFIGGGDDSHGTETVHSLICDQSNNVYMYGVTSSDDFPISGGYQSVFGGGSSLSIQFNGTNFHNDGTDIYVAKFSSNGQNLMGSTYMGGASNDGVNYKVSSGNYSNVADYDSLSTNYGDQFRGEIMLDSLGNCIVASCTRSTNFPVVNAFQPTNAGKQDGVIFKLSSDLSALQWSSYYGGSENDACYSVKIDSSFNIVFSGGTCSSNLPAMGTGWQSSYNGGKTDGFVAKLSPNGSTLTNGSYIGTSNYDQAFFVEIDRNDNVFLLGQSAGGAFPVINAGFVNPGSSQFVVKLDPTLSTALNSTVFGNGAANINISPAAFLVDICGNMYISGWGANILQTSPLGGMPVTPDAFQGTAPNGFDFYLLVIERDFGGPDPLYASYIGGSSAQEHVDGGTSRFDKNGVVYQSVCGGCTGVSDFPTTPGAHSSSNLSTNCNNLVFKFDFELIPDADFTADNTLGCAPFTVTFDNFSTDSDSYQWVFGNGDSTSVIFEPTVTYDSAGVYQVFLVVTDSICLLTDTAELTITVYDSLELTTTIDQELCQPIPLDLTAYTNGTADNFIWSSNSSFTDTLNTDLQDSVLSITPSGPVTYYVEVSNGGCSLVDSVVVDFIGSSLILTGNDSICAGELTQIAAQSSNPSITFTYVWSPDSVIQGSNTGSSITVAPLQTQYIVVTASSANGCVVQDSIQVFVGNIPNGAVQATASEYLVAQGSSVTLNGEPNGYAYSWSPTSGLSSPNSQSTTAFIEETTLFTLSVTDGICTKSDTVLVKVFEFICGDPFVYIPNAFSPNGDNENDVLYVRGNLIKDMVLRIYDRWGELVFESYDRSNGWDGTFHGKPLDPDTYDYYLKVTCVDDMESIIKGNVTLMR